MGSFHVFFLASGLFGQSETPVIPPLIEALHDRDLEVRAYVGTALASLGAPTVDPLIKALRDPDRYQRAGAAYALGRLGMVALPAKPQLLTALKDEDKDVRRHAAYALSRILAAEREMPTSSSLPAPVPEPR